MRRSGAAAMSLRRARRGRTATPWSDQGCRIRYCRIVVPMSVPFRHRFPSMKRGAPMPVQPYLFFEGRADEAIAFSGKTLDAEVLMRLTYPDAPDGNAQCPDCSTPPPDHVIPAGLRIDGNQRA